MSSSPQRTVHRAAERRAERRDAALTGHRRGVRLRRSLATVTAGLGAVAAVVAVTVLGGAAPVIPPAVEGGAEPAVVTSSGRMLQCAGPLVLPEGADAGMDEDFTAGSTDARTEVRAALLSDLAGRFPGALLTALGGGQAQELTPGQPLDVQQGAPATADESGVPVSAAQAFTQAVTGPGVLQVEPLGGAAPAVAAVTTAVAGDGDLAGVATAPCQSPGHRLWIAGADTTAGSTSVLTLVNPSASASTVDVDLFGRDGLIEAAGTRGVTLAPGEQRSLVLGGLAPEQAHVAVEVRAAGGGVTATVQQHRLQGLTPAGVELLTPTARPTRELTVTAVVVPDTDTLGREAAASQGPAVLLAAPTATETTTAQLELLGPAGPVDVDLAPVTLPPGAAVRVALPGVPAGTYSLRVQADQPVVAAAQGTAAVGEDAVDVAVTTAGEPLRQRMVAAVPSEGLSTLLLGADPQEAGPEVSRVRVTGILADGSRTAPVEREVSGQALADVQMGELGEAGNVVAVEVDVLEGSVQAALSVASPAGLSSVVLRPAPAAEAAVPVRIAP